MAKFIFYILYLLMSRLLSSLFNRYRRVVSPAAGLCHILNNTGLLLPDGFPYISPNEIPCLSARRAIWGFSEDSCPVRKNFRGAVIETLSPDNFISLINITGCIASKSQMTSYADMTKTKTSEKFVQKFRDTVHDLAEGVFVKGHDTMAGEGNPLPVYRQSWDGRMWFANYNGSHRSSTVWKIDHENGYERVLPAVITDFAFSESFKNTCETHSIFMFRPSSLDDFADAIQTSRKLGIILSFDRMPGSNPVTANWCLIINKNHSNYPEIKKAIGPAFDLSDWIADPSLYASFENTKGIENQSLRPYDMSPALA